MPLISWIRRNKLVSLLLLIVLYFLFSNRFSGFLGLGNSMMKPEPGYDYGESFGAPAGVSSSLSLPSVGALKREIMPPQSEPVPQTGTQNRLVIQNSQISLLVKDVTDLKNQIINFAQKAGGYMVTSNVSNPQDAPTATVVVRVPADKLEDTLAFLKTNSIKVVSEFLEGQDVTDQYVDVEKRIAILEETKNKFEEILSRAQEISDITNLNQQIITIQSQIDSFRGQQEALKQNAQLAKLTIYLSTDEIALPYAPSETFRPSVIFKLAIRSLVGKLRQIATLVIWLAVYAVIWVPVGLLVYFLYRRFGKRTI